MLTGLPGIRVRPAQPGGPLTSRHHHARAHAVGPAWAGHARHAVHRHAGAPAAPAPSTPGAPVAVAVSTSCSSQPGGRANTQAS